jgi:hypothetical protein
VQSSVPSLLTWLRSGDTWCAEGFIREAGQQLTSLSLDVDDFWDSTLHLLLEQHSLQELTLHRFQCRQMHDWVVHGELADFSKMTVSKFSEHCACAAKSFHSTPAHALQPSTLCPWQV